MRGKFTIVYQRSHDIDWFAQKGGIMIHAMSFGGLLPKSVNDWIRNLNMLRTAYRREHSYGVVYSDYANALFDRNEGSSIQNRDAYLRHFSDMASRGFWSFDRDPNDENVYHLIANPVGMVSVRERMRGLPELTDAEIQVQTIDDGRITDATVTINRGNE